VAIDMTANRDTRRPPFDFGVVVCVIQRSRRVFVMICVMPVNDAAVPLVVRMRQVPVFCRQARQPHEAERGEHRGHFAPARREHA
jgi:hypothetical protein